MMSSFGSNPLPTAKEDVMEQAYDRPFGISVLSVLLILSGAASLFMQIAFSGVMSQASALVGVSKLTFMGSVLFVNVLSFSAGIGMWLGKRWGWWLAVFYVVYAIFRYSNVLLTIPDIMTSAGSAASDPTSYYLKYGVRIAGHALLLVYLFRENPRFYFGLPHTQSFTVKSLTAVAGITALLFAAVTLIVK